MQDVSGVGCDTAEELIIRGAEQVGDGRQIIVAVVKPLAATQQRVETHVDLLTVYQGKHVTGWPSLVLKTLSCDHGSQQEHTTKSTTRKIVYSTHTK